jgi:DNA-binding NarL/FixJ family response regulator
MGSHFGYHERTDRLYIARSVTMQTNSISQIRKVARLAKNGMSDQKISEKIGLSLNVVRNFRRYGGVFRNKSKAEHFEKIIKLRDEGLSNSEISAELGLSKNTVESYASQCNAKRQPYMSSSMRITNIKEMREKGMQKEEIAKTLNINVDTVEHYLRLINSSMGLPNLKGGKQVGYTRRLTSRSYFKPFNKKKSLVIAITHEASVLGWKTGDLVKAIPCQTTDEILVMLCPKKKN